MKNKYIIDLENIETIYEGENLPVIQNINLKIKSGEFIAIIGNNGSGKSTLVKHVIGLNKPNKGTVIINREDSRKTTAAQLARKISFLFQNPDNQIFNATVLKEVKYAPENCKMPKQEAVSRATTAIHAVGLKKFINQKKSE